MCLPRALVIVIVKSRDSRGARFKYINVREEFTMVARLPQQVLLLLVLVTGTTPGIHEGDRSSAIGQRGAKSSDEKTTSISPRQKLLATTWKEPRGSLSRVSSPARGLDRIYSIDTVYTDDSIEWQSLWTSERHSIQARNVETDAIRHAVSITSRNPGGLLVTESFFGSNREPLQSDQAANPESEQADLTRTRELRRTDASRNGGNVARGIDAAITETTGGKPLLSSGIQLHPRAPIAATEPNLLLLHPDSQVIERQMYSLSEPHPSTRPPRFQSESNEDQAPPVSGSVTSSGAEMKTRNDWLAEPPANLQHSASHRLLQHENHGPTVPTTALAFPRRYMRDANKNPCEKFEMGDPVKQEFYSPNYPHEYPPSIDCVRVLEADKGMLIKLDFRDHFELESPTGNDKDAGCRFDYLEVRDGQYGYSTLIGTYCSKNFPPEITSRSRYLWLNFHSDDTIEYKGFKAVWNMVPRPTYPGVPPEQEPCIKYVTRKAEALISSDDVKEEKKLAEKNSMALDCLWIIQAKDGWQMQVTFSNFGLEKPNDCDANFLMIFGERVDMRGLMRHFCGSIAEAVVVKSSLMHLRFYLEPKAINSSFQALMSAMREKKGDSECAEDEYDCDDATCIEGHLRCNKRENCRLKWDEDPSICGTGQDGVGLYSTRIVIILVLFSLILFGLFGTFTFNCIRKLIRDHRIIREQIRQSRENRLDEIGRKSTPGLVTITQTDICQHDSESPSLEMDPTKELIPGTTIIAHEYAKDLVLEMNYNTREMNDIHQSNNVSNATQERLQETSEEPEMCDSSCQTRESLFDPRISENISSPAFSTFGYHSAAQNAANMRQPSRSPLTQASNHSGASQRQASEQCSACPSSHERDSQPSVCPRHTAIPAPPGWSAHDPAYAAVPTYQRYQSPKPEREPQSYHPLPRQVTAGSGEKYGSFLYGGSGRGSSNTSSTQHSAKFAASDPRYRAEAVIEVDQKRPFSIESTKSAPDVIATH